MRSSLLILPIIALVFTGCSTSIKKYESKELDSIENEDFKAIKEERYVSDEDFYNIDLDKFEDSLAQETMAKLPKARLSDVPVTKNSIEQISQLCYQGNFQNAFNLIDNSYNRFKKHPTYWNQVGTCYYLSGDDRKALLYYNKALEVNRNYAPAINNLGVLFLKSGLSEKALVAFKQAKKLSKFSQTPTFNLAQLYLQYGVVNLAKQYFQALYSQNKRDVDVKNGLATVFLLEGNISQSVKMFSLIDERHWKNPAVGLNFAVALKLNKEFDSSRDVFDDVSRSQLGKWKNYYAIVGRFVKGSTK